MGAMKELLLEFCELVYPYDGDKQAQLARDIVGSPALCPTLQTVEQFRRVYEDTGVAPRMDLERMQELVDEARSEGFFDRCPQCGRPAVTCDKCGNHQYCQACNRCLICGHPRR